MNLAYNNLTKITPFYGGIFSNWYRIPFTYKDKSYNCVEQYMMAEKAWMFKDFETYAKILKTEHPRDQKALGRTVKNFCPLRWSAVAKHIVFAGCYAKFTQNLDVYNAIIATRGTLLVEASPTDCIWGVGLAENNPDIYDKSKWRGTNWLGEVLTDVRIGIIGE